MLDSVHFRVVPARYTSGEVHPWRINLNCSAISRTALKATLSTEEVENASRFRSTALCDRRTVARGALRCILSTYARSEPNSLVLQLGPNGKPELAWSVENIPFSLSHTGGLILLAITGRGRVGTDAETLPAWLELDDLSRRLFAPLEGDEVLRLPHDARFEAFWTSWTRKEAFLKALSVRHSVPLDTFQATLRADQPARLLSVDWDKADQWTLVDVGKPDVATAIAEEGPAPC